MSYTLETIRNVRSKSIKGRQLGITYDDYLAGPKDMVTAVEDVTTTAGTSMVNYGLTRLLTSGSSQNGIQTLQAVTRPGTRKRIVLMSSSTGCQLIKASGGMLFYGASVSTIGSTVLNFLGRGAEVTLEAATTLAWMMFGSMSSLVSSDHLNLSFTTST